MKITSALVAAILLAGGQLASAQTAPTAADQLKPGAAIYDTAGTAIGSVESVTGGNVLVSTGTHKIAVPQASFGVGAKGPVLAATREQLDGAAIQAETAAKAALAAKLVPGAEVHSTSGPAVVGTVKLVEGELITVSTPKGEVRVPANGFTTGPAGLVIGLSASDFDAAVAAAKPAA